MSEPTRGRIVKGRILFIFENGPFTDEMGEDIAQAQRDGYSIHSLATHNTHCGMATVVVAAKASDDKEQPPTPPASARADSGQEVEE